MGTKQGTHLSTLIIINRQPRLLLHIMIGVLIFVFVGLFGMYETRPGNSSKVNKVTNKTVVLPTSLEAEENIDNNWVYYPPGTHDHRAKDYYAEYDLTFIGYGENSGGSGHIQGIGSFESCIKWCYDKKRSYGCDGRACSGVVFYWAHNLCNCWAGDDHGHHDDNELLHYRFK